LDFSDIIPQSDLEAYEKAGFGRLMGFGKRPCVIVIDMTYGFVDPSNPLAYGSMGATAVRNLVDLLYAARRKQIPIIYTTGLNAVSNLASPSISRKVIVSNPRSRENEIVEEIKPAAEDIVIPKGKASVFFGTPLLSILHHFEVDTLIVTGAMTSGCVRATVVEAASYDYYVIVPLECVADRAIVPHKVNLFDMHMKYADVIPMSQVIKYIGTLPTSR
jgi:maleamate amidohydrolase